MLIATWNVNSLNARLPQVVEWLDANQPDVLFMQELKGLSFPAKAFAEIGYQTEFVSQKSHHGVATASRLPIKVLAKALPGDEADRQARYLEMEIGGLRLINIYLPNGNPIGTAKFEYKLAWMDRLKKHLASLKKRKISVVVGGDFNVIPEDKDCYSPKAWATNALFQPEAQEKLRAIFKLGYIDAFRHFNIEAGEYTFWDYFRNHWKNNRGIRIDHFLVSADLKDRITGCMIDKGPRDNEHPSDHTPIALAIR